MFNSLKTKSELAESNSSGDVFMPITMAPLGERFVIRKITGKGEVRQRLAELGFVIGANVTVVNSMTGNLIIQIKDSRIALDKKIAGRILI